MISFVLAIISIVLIFVLKSFIGILFAVLSLVFGLIQIKKKKVMNYIGLVLSILILIYSIYAFVIAASTVSNTINSAKERTYQNIEKSLERGALISIQQDEEECAESGTACTLPPNLTKKLDYANGYDDYKNTLKDCDGYIDLKYESLEWTANVYLKCPDYQTEGYNQ